MVSIILLRDDGWQLVTRPGIRRVVILPLLANIILT